MLSWELCFCQVNKFSLSSFSFHDSILPIFFFPICKFPIELFFYFIFSTRKLNVDVPPTIFIFYLHLTFLQWNPSITITSVSPIIDYSEIYVKKKEKFMSITQIFSTSVILILGQMIFLLWGAVLHIVGYLPAFQASMQEVSVISPCTTCP